MKKIIFTAMLLVPLLAISQSATPQDSTLGFFELGLNYTNWEKVPAGITTQFKNSVGFYGAAMNEGYLIKNNQHWCLAIGFVGEYNVVGSNASLSTDGSGKKILAPIQPGTSYAENNITFSSGGVPIELHYNIYLGKKNDTKLFISAGYIIEYTSLIQTNYTGKGDTSTVVTYNNDKNANSFRQEITARAGVGFRGRKGRWFYISADGFYGLNSLYKSNDGPYLVNCSTGISLSYNLWN